MTILVLTAVRAELASVLEPFGAEAPAGVGKVVEARAGGRRLLAAHTGVGPLNAAFCLGRLLGGADRDFDGEVQGVVNLGVAGSFDAARLPLGSTFVASSETWPEFGLWTADGEGESLDPAGIGFAQLDGPAGPVYASLSLSPRETAGWMGLPLPAWPEAPVLTVAGVSGHPKRARALHARHGALAEGMEGFALALGATRAGLPFLEARTISNLVGSRPPRDWDLGGALKALARVSEQLFANESQRRG